MHSDSCRPRSVHFADIDWEFEEKKSSLTASTSRKQARKKRQQRKKLANELHVIPEKAFLDAARRGDDTAERICALASCEDFLQAADNQLKFSEWSCPLKTKLGACLLDFDTWKDETEITQKLSIWMTEAVDMKLYTKPASPAKSSVSSCLHTYSDSDVALDSEDGSKPLVVDGKKAEKFAGMVEFMGEKTTEWFRNCVKVFDQPGTLMLLGCFINDFLTRAQERELCATHGKVRDEMIAWFRNEESAGKKREYLKEVSNILARKDHISGDSDSHSTQKVDASAGKPPPRPPQSGSTK